MHDDETMNTCLPLRPYQARAGHDDHRDLEHSAQEVDKLGGKSAPERGVGGYSVRKGICASDEFWTSCTDTGMDVGGLWAGGASQGDEDIASNVEGFLDDFLALVGPGVEPDGIDMIAGDGGGGVRDEDLAWLDNPDVLLPAPSRPEEVEGDLDDSGGVSSPEACGRVTSPSCPVPPQQPAQLSQASMEVRDPAADNARGGGVSASDWAQPAACAGASQALLESGAWGGREVEGRGEGSPRLSASAGTPSAAVGISAPPASPWRASSSGEEDAAGGEVNAAVDPGPSSLGFGCVDSTREKERRRRQAVERFLEKRKKRRWTKGTTYGSRQRVANNRPRNKGRFMPLVSDFVPVAELRRRQMARLREAKEAARSRNAREEGQGNGFS